MPEDMGRDRDLVLPPNTYAFVLDSTKGKVSVFVGPYKLFKDTPFEGFFGALAGRPLALAGDFLPGSDNGR